MRCLEAPGFIRGERHNQLQSLPPEIGRLQNLQTLEVSGHRLVNLPPELWQLSNLQELKLSGNLLA